MDDAEQPYCDTDIFRFYSLGENQIHTIEYLLKMRRACLGSEIRKALGMSPSNFSSTVHRLENRGIVVLEDSGPPFILIVGLTRRAVDYYQHYRGKSDV